MDASPFGTLHANPPRHPRQAREAETRNALALTATCHQLRCETLALFWSTASFRIVADTLTAYSYHNDPVPDVLPMNRARDINRDRAKVLRKWLEKSGIGHFAPLLRPIELELGVWDPRIHADMHHGVVLSMLAGNTKKLTKMLASIEIYASSSEGDDEHSDDFDEDDDEDEDRDKAVAPACTLLFKVQVKPSTALGSIRVPNELKQALITVANLSKIREENVQASFDEGMLTPYGRVVLMNDVVMCRSVADMLIRYIVKDEEEEEANNSMMGRKQGQAVKKGQAGKKGHTGKKAKLGIQ